MGNLKSLLFVFSFMLITLTGYSTAAALPVKDTIGKDFTQIQEAIDDAMALIESAIDEALAMIQEAVDERPALIKEATGDAVALIEEAIDDAIALLEEAISEDLALIKETTDEAFTEAQEAIEAVADSLEQQQVNIGLGEAIWPEEADFTGSIVAGMVSAYELTINSVYKAAAELGGNYILSFYEDGFRGDEAFALIRLSHMSHTPDDNLWRIAVSDFYSGVKDCVDSTAGYICQFAEMDPSIAVFYLANHVVAAYDVDAADKEIWRQALISHLAQVHDCCADFPVMALGIATWALSRTGPLDDTLIDPSGTGATCWRLKKLADLPGLVLSHQVPDDESCAGNFYRRFDHRDGGFDRPVSGYTEDAIFATLGLIAASRADSALDLDAAILAARRALLSRVDSEGRVFEHLELSDSDYCAYGGEMLQVLCECATTGDVLDAATETEDP